MSRSLFIFLFGSSPVWVASLFVWLFGRQSGSGEYWASAPWMVIYALPFCAVTTLIAFFLVRVHTAVKGSRAKKLGAAILCAVALAGAAMLVIQRGIHQRKEAEVAAAKEVERVIQFVSAHPDARAVAGVQPRMWIGPTHVDRDGVIAEYEVVMQGQRELFAIVAVARASGAAEFSLRCITSLSLGRRAAGADWCAAGVVSPGASESN